MRYIKELDLLYPKDIEVKINNKKYTLKKMSLIEECKALLLYNLMQESLTQLSDSDIMKFSSENFNKTLTDKDKEMIGQHIACTKQIIQIAFGESESEIDVLLDIFIKYKVLPIESIVGFFKKNNTNKSNKSTSQQKNDYINEEIALIFRVLTHFTPNLWNEVTFLYGILTILTEDRFKNMDRLLNFHDQSLLLMPPYFANGGESNKINERFDSLWSDVYGGIFKTEKKTVRKMTLKDLIMEKAEQELKQKKEEKNVK